MKFESRDLSLAAVFGALYAVVNVVQSVTVGNPTIYGPVQLRIADALIPLAALLGWPVVGGVTVGCFAANAYYFISPTDVILGPIANLLASSLILLLRKHRFLACISGAFPIGIIVGGYLWLFFPTPGALGVFPVWLASILSITMSSLVALGIVGYLVLSILSRKTILQPLKSRGLKVLDQE
jgi:uncharacterized membrane protein